ncbi:MAG TPA: 30S ribosomal protein S8 [Candidatus Moranbacteria bacterium]|nr:MAG: 30S ribosomal protein S8, small subunit ribosomal protein S8 [Parcubacteria group bacterium GW2011_GWC1_36_108]KKQ00473.1 MAG: 30S ribosomal protein S8 [Candidatus Moranbacteria bacterium GW2011_GWD1_36_198]KKQ01705.1 MAG: 30S ribosomal protein S8 [Candidatus Moranbacteria bacterium GW2011_GWD2_36_198]MDD5463884.1 30S ribosomal protein S8 [Candidatus Moranbacteria bacterium]HAR99958.1 30S ribosomal protein S8 [Candidatus Moranbacteria bacterium]
MLDPIADMLTRIRNAQMVKHKEVLVPFSKLKLSIAKILEQRNFIESVKKEMGETFPVLRIVLRYEVVSNTEKNPAISEIKRVSRQGQRIYVKKTDIKRVKNGYGISVISTSQGMMTGDKAKKLGLGGEVICEVW